MWRRKLTASIVKCSSSPCSSQAAASTVRSKSVCFVSVGVNAVKSCVPGQQRRGRVERSAVERLRPPERPALLERASGRYAAATRYRYARDRAEKRALKSAGASSAATTATSSRQRRVECLRRPSGGGPPVDAHARHLSRRVDAGVGTAGDRELRPARDRRRRACRGEPSRRFALPAGVPSRGTRLPSYSSVSFSVVSVTAGSTTSVRPSTSRTTTSSPAPRPAAQRARHSSPATRTWPSGMQSGGDHRPRPTSASAPTTDRRRCRPAHDQQSGLRDLPRCAEPDGDPAPRLVEHEDREQERDDESHQAKSAARVSQSAGSRA